MAYNTFDFQTADPYMYSLLKDFAKKNRQNPTEAERLLWYALKYAEIGGA